MTIQTVLGAASSWFFDMRLVNPLNRPVDRLLGPSLAEWYGLRGPTFDNTGKGQVWTGGEFAPPAGPLGDSKDLSTPLRGVELQVFLDGMLAKTTTDTNDTDVFLGQMLERLAGRQLITWRPDWVQYRRYTTELLVVPDRPLNRFRALGELMSELVYAEAPAPVAAQLRFDVPPSTPRKHVAFLFQPGAGANTFLSSGPFTLEQHLQVLRELEWALAA